MENAEINSNHLRTASVYVNDRLKKKRILVIDDSLDLLALIKTILEINSFDVTTVTNGLDGLQALSCNELPDLILLDMRMDGMSGLAFLVELEKAQPDVLAKIPVVFLTADESVSISKAVGFIRKPFELNKFVELIERYILNGPQKPYHPH